MKVTLSTRLITWVGIPAALVLGFVVWNASRRSFDRVSAQTPGVARPWDSARMQFSDISIRHVAYPAASASVAAGVLSTANGNAFQPSRPVTGAEVLDAISKLEALSGRP